MSDVGSEPANAPVAHREPPPSLGMVAHIWAGHMGPGERLEISQTPHDAEEVALAPVIELLPPPVRVQAD